MKKSHMVLLHLGYWLLYSLLLTVVFLATAGVSKLTNGPSMGWVAYIIYLSGIGTGLAAFYMGHGPAFSQGLSTKNRLRLMLWILAGAFGGGLLGYCLLMVPSHGRAFFRDLEISFWISILVGLPNVLVGLGLRAFVDWFTTRREQEELKSKNREMEMALLKAQINPHFLFNTIANIDVLIETNPAMASEYLQKLSDVMRFMLYETQADTLPLAREMDYIDRYVALQRIRFSQPEAVQFSVQGDADSIQIAPLLFIPFIENAFKYGETRKSDPLIEIAFHISPGKIVMECRNRYLPGSHAAKGGLGHELMRRRLDLVYPGRYALNVQDANEVYALKLVISLP